MTGGPLPVVAISGSSALGGSEWSLLEFARRAGAHGIDLAVLLPRGGPLQERLEAHGVKVALAPAPASFLELTQRRGAPGLAQVAAFTRGLWQWSRAIRNTINGLFSPQSPVSRPLLYSNGFKAHLVAALLGGRRVWHLREFPPARTGPAWKLLAGAIPTGAIANSNAVADAWALLGLRRPAVAYNGVDLELFRPAPRGGWIHQSLGLDPAARLLGMPAVLARWKGHLGVVSAFERIAADRPDLHLVLVGGAIYDTAAERGFAEELVKRVRGARTAHGASLTSRIHFLKHQSEPWKLYPEFDLVVHFSTRPEPFGRVVAESLAAGVPVVAARAGGPCEIVAEGETGWLVPPGDIGALAGALARGLEAVAGAGAAELSAACRRRAEERFGAETYAAEVARLLKAAAS